MLCRLCDITIDSYYLKYAHSEELVLDFVLEHGLIARSTECANCGQEVSLDKSENTYTYKCQRRLSGGGKCSYIMSARTHTFFDSNALSVEEIVKFCVFWLLLRNPKQADIMNELSLASKTVAQWSKLCREVCVQWVLEGSNKIGGPDIVVEIGVSKFGKRKYNVDSVEGGQWVFGGVQHGDKRNFFLVPTQQKHVETLIDLIIKWILPGTIIISDCWKSYEVLDHPGYVHLRENHPVEFVSTDKSGYTHLKSIAKMRGKNVSVYAINIQAKKRSVKYNFPAFVRRKGHFEGYFAEHIFKQACNREHRVHNFLKAAAALYPPQ